MRVPVCAGGPGAGALHGVRAARALDLRRGVAAGAAARAPVLLQLRRGRPHRRRVRAGAPAAPAAAPWSVQSEACRFVVLKPCTVTLAACSSVPVGIPWPSLLQLEACMFRVLKPCAIKLAACSNALVGMSCLSLLRDPGTPLEKAATLPAGASAVLTAAP